jgi:hypothetical protein
MLSDDVFTRMGADLPVESPAKATLKGDKIKSFTGTLPATS